MKVLMFGWEFPPHISGGLGTACYGLTKQLGGQGVEIAMVLPHASEPMPDSPVELLDAGQIELGDEGGAERFSSETMRMLRVDTLLRPYLDTESYRVLVQCSRQQAEAEPASAAETQPQVRDESVPPLNGPAAAYAGDLVREVTRYSLVGTELGRQEDFDLIHAHDWMTMLAAVEAKEASGKPLVVHVHATEFDRTGFNPNPDIYRIERYGMEMADHIIAVSMRTKGLLVDRYAVPAAKISVVHNAVTKQTLVNRGQAKKHLKEKIVLFLGRVTRQKGPDYFVEAAHQALKKMADTGIEVRFVMAGSGDMLPRMIERIAQLRIHRHFHFTGFLRDKELETMFAISDLYVMPSVSEPFGITPFEALLHGVPIIVSKQSGITEVLSHVLKVDFWDVDELSDAIVRILSDDKLARALVTAGMRELEDVSWEKAAGKVKDIYAQCLARRQDRGKHIPLPAPKPATTAPPQAPPTH